MIRFLKRLLRRKPEPQWVAEAQAGFVGHVLKRPED